MTLDFTGTISKDCLTLTFASDRGEIQLLPATTKMKATTESPKIFVYLKAQQPTLITQTAVNQKLITEYQADQLLLITPPWELEIPYLIAMLHQTWTDNGLKVATLTENASKVPANQQKTLSDYQEELFLVLKALGIHTEKVRHKPAKAQHRWNKAVSTISFFIDHEGATGEAQWQKRNEMLLKKGAQLKMNPPLKKDGSIGFDVRFAEKLRGDLAAKISGDRTTEDIVLKSVNELGLFLYYGGTNGWLVLKDQAGKTIDEYTVVK